MSYTSYSSRAFSLPKNFYQDNFNKINQLNNNKILFKTFDNNRYAKRDRVSIFRSGDLSVKLFNKVATVEYTTMIHSSNNVVIIANIKTEEDLIFEQIQRLNDNWIPTENIFCYKEKDLNLRNILNFGFALFLSKIMLKKIEIKDLILLDDLDSYLYDDKDIQDIEKIYSFFNIPIDDFFIIPTMYGNTTILNDTQKDIIGQFEFLNINNKINIHISRNYAFINSSYTYLEPYIYNISFFNLLKHFKNRISSEVSMMLDDVNSIKRTDYNQLLEDSFDLQKEFTVNYDELYNINIWHDSELLKLSNFIRYENGWNIANEIEENNTKLQRFIELTTEMSKGKFQSFMDSISLLIGILGIFAFFDLIQVLNQEPYSGVHWLVSFSLIIFCLPILLVVVAKKSKFLMKIFNKIL